MKTIFTPVVSLALAVLLCSCSDIDSKDIKTSGIYTEASITAEDDSTNVFVRMRTGKPLDADTIILSSGDQLSASMSGNSVVLTRTDTDAYSGSLPGSPNGALVTVSLSRSEDPDAPSSTVALPNTFAIDAPGSGETFTAEDNITVVWTPAEPNNTATVAYQLNCRVYDSNGIPSGANYGRAYTTADSGSHATSINDILNVLGTQHELVEGVSCPFEVTVTRTATGVLDPALVKGGVIAAIRQKTVVVNVVP